MAEKLSHFEQYKMLREEIMQYMRETYRTEFWGAAALAGVYSFLFTHKAHAHDLVWFIPPFALFICGLRTWLLFRRMRLIGRYLRAVEEEAFPAERKLIGWERYLSKQGGIGIVVSSICIWTAVFVAALAASIYFWFCGYGFG